MNTDIEIRNRCKTNFGAALIFSFVLIALSLLSCTSEKAADVTAKNTAGRGAPAVGANAGNSQMSLQLTPSQADRNSLLAVIPRGFRLYDAKYAWLVNGEPVPDATNCTLKVCDCTAKRGDAVQAKAIVNGREILSDKVIIGNTPPELGYVKLMPEVFKEGDMLYVDAQGKDADGDPVAVVYEWTKNGQSVATSKSIGCPVKRGDRITVKITPYDGVRYGQPVVLEREIKNMPPAITGDSKYDFSRGVFTYQVHAADPDGDTLAYSLKAAPAGMSINPSTGLITWRVPAEFNGKTSFTACASDGHGGEATQSFNFEVK